MKKILLGLLVAAVAVGAGLAVSNHYTNYQNKKTHDAQVAAQAAADKVNKVQSRLNTVSAAYDHERIECEKGRAAYDTLNAIPKAPKAAQPVCGPAVLPQ